MTAQELNVLLGPSSSESFDRAHVSLAQRMLGARKEALRWRHLNPTST